jgi:DNA-binding CsgD family transcriptional regulator
MSAIELVEPVCVDSCAARLTDTILGYNEKDLRETLKDVAAEIGVAHISIIRFAQDKSADTSVFTAAATYSNEWLARYFLKKYVNIDPALAYGRSATTVFDWEMLRGGCDPSGLAFLDDAAVHGVGPRGLSIPVRSRRGVFSVVSFTSDCSRAEWERYKNDNMAKLQLLAVLIESAANINFKLPPPSVKLSRREEQCLIWAARGKTYQEIGEILDLTFGSVKTHLDSARHKLNCMNLTHTVAVALASGVLPAKAVQGDIRMAPD